MNNIESLGVILAIGVMLSIFLWITKYVTTMAVNDEQVKKFISKWFPISLKIQWVVTIFVMFIWALFMSNPLSDGRSNDNVNYAEPSRTGSLTITVEEIKANNADATSKGDEVMAEAEEENTEAMKEAEEIFRTTKPNND